MAFGIIVIRAVYTLPMWMWLNNRFVLCFVEQIVLRKLKLIMRGCIIKIISNKTISEELYDYVITLDKKRIENYHRNHIIGKEHSDIDVIHHAVNKVINEYANAGLRLETIKKLSKIDPINLI